MNESYRGRFLYDEKTGLGSFTAAPKSLSSCWQVKEKVIDNTQFSIAIGVIAIGGLCLIFGIGPWKISFLLIVGTISVVSVRSLPAAVSLLLLINPFWIIFRNSYPDEIILSGWRTLILCWIYYIWILEVILKITIHSYRPHIYSGYLLIFFFFTTLLPILNTPRLIVNFLGVRENIIVIPMYLVGYTIFVNNNAEAKRALNCMLAAATFLAFLHLLYFYELIGPLHTLLSEKVYHKRELFMWLLPRMTSFVGYGPSGVGLYFASHLGLVLFWNNRKFLQYISIVLLLWASILTLSFTAVLAIIIILLVWQYNRKTPKLMNIVVGIISVFLVGYFLMGKLFIGESFISYLWRATTKSDLFTYFPTSFSEWITGGGWRIASGSLLGEYSTRQVDGHWITLLYQMGLISFGLLFCWLLTVTKKVVKGIRYWSRRPWDTNKVVVLSASAMYLSSFLGGLHIATFTQRPVDICMVTAASIAISNAFPKKFG